MADYYTKGVAGILAGGEITEDDIHEIDAMLGEFNELISSDESEIKGAFETHDGLSIPFDDATEDPSVVFEHRVSGAKTLVLEWEDGCAMSAIGELIHRWLKARGKVKTCIQLSEAYTCSADRCGAFSGGTMRVTSKGMFYAGFAKGIPNHTNTLIV